MSSSLPHPLASLHQQSSSLPHFFNSLHCPRRPPQLLSLLRHPAPYDSCRLLTPSDSLRCAFRHHLLVAQTPSSNQTSESNASSESVRFRAHLKMGNIGEKMDVDFIVSTGDNFYDSGLVDEDDPAFYDSFTNIYTAPSLQKQWYAVLGNHDYRGNVLAQLSPVLTQRDNKWLCIKSFILHAGNVELFFVDTTPFQDKYFTDTDHTYDWRGVLPREQYLTNLLKDVDVALKESTAKWKIVVGHHTIFSAGDHGNTQELVDKLLPILLENEVNLYINGHDHCLQHISHANSQLQFLTSGGGSKAWRGEISRWNLDEMKFYYDGQGFMAVEVTESEVHLTFYDIFGNILHKWSGSGHKHSVM